jgi:hypothetical protein
MAPVEMGAGDVQRNGKKRRNLKAMRLLSKSPQKPAASSKRHLSAKSERYTRLALD